MRFPPTTLSPDEIELRGSIREFLAAELPPRHLPGAALGGGHDPEFSRQLAKAGFVGLCIPTSYGGAGRGAVERFVVIEELLASGAPVSAHWVSDRQTAPTILRFGTEQQRQRFLPTITRGECFFSIGMSEPDAGSDLAAVRTKAERADGGWRVSGTKVWTSAADLNHYFVVLCRTAPMEDDRHKGLSQLIVDLRSPGVRINPIQTLDGDYHFNEVVLDDVFVPDDMVLGTCGDGWHQVTSELGFERSGPDRWLSTFALFREWLRRNTETTSDTVLAAFGRITARYRAIRNLSLSVARRLDDGDAPNAEAALVKDLGTTFEQEIVETARSLQGSELDPDVSEPFEHLLMLATTNAPAFTIRGGTTEILRTIVARELTR